MPRHPVLSFLAVLLFSLVFSLVTLFGFSNHARSNPAPEKTVTFGILVPLEHAALKEIVEGFEETIAQAHIPYTILFDVQNAQGDIKLQRTIIERFLGLNVDYIVPIGTTSTQMTLAFIKDKPIISLAADYPESERQKRHPINITGVLDEIGGKKKLDFIKHVLPSLKKLTIIFHSGNEKNYNEIQALVDYGKTMDIEIQKLSINTLPDLETTVQGIDQDSEAIMILKDHLVASGIRLLIPTAEARHLPLIASDEGSVAQGATFALGVKERSIGVEGGKLAIKLLAGTPIEALSMVHIQSLEVFYNKKALQKQDISKDTLEQAAHSFGYRLIGK